MTEQQLKPFEEIKCAVMKALQKSGLPLFRQTSLFAGNTRARKDG